MTPLQLFRQGKDTLEIAKLLRISEAQVLRRIHEDRSREKGLPAEVMNRGVVRRVA